MHIVQQYQAMYMCNGNVIGIFIYNCRVSCVKIKHNKVLDASVL